MLDADPKAIPQINFTANLDREGNKDFISFLKKPRKLFLNFHKELSKFYECNFIELNSIKCKVYFNSHQLKNDTIQ